MTHTLRAISLAAVLHLGSRYLSGTDRCLVLRKTEPD